MHAMAPLSMSATIAGYELAVGKYAWNLGLCQWVTPGMMTRSMSAITSCQLSGFSGASAGISGRR